MSWFNPRIVTRLAAVVALAALTAGCFQPMYAEKTPGGGPGLREKLSTVEFAPLNVPNGSREARLGVAIRNELMFKAYGSAVGAPPLYTLSMRLSTSRTSIILDPTTARPDIENYGIDAIYELKDIASGKTVMRGNTTARVSYNIPGQEQRFARDRGLRDAEDRAAKEIAENISTRLASYFYSNI
ncbi:MAG: LPS assembly lipoprotein LptE [Afipia sp.]